MRVGIIGALSAIAQMSLSAAGINMHHIELAGSGNSSDFSYRAGACKRPKSVAQVKREAKRRKNIKKRKK